MLDFHFFRHNTGKIASHLVCTLLVSIATQAQARFHVVIDAGHGGHDSGATRGLMREADIALQISKKLGEFLENDPQFKVTLTRQNDSHLSLEDRGDLANQVDAKAFISIHLNASPDSSAHGAEVYFQNQLPPDEEALFLANIENENTDGSSRPRQRKVKPTGDLFNILEDLDRNYRIRRSADLSRSLVQAWQGPIQLRKRKIQQAPFFVLSGLQIPSALVEIGFISHPRDAKLLSDAAVQTQLAKNIYIGLLRYKEIIDKSF